MSLLKQMDSFTYTIVFEIVITFLVSGGLCFKNKVLADILPRQFEQDYTKFGDFEKILPLSSVLTNLFII